MKINIEAYYDGWCVNIDGESFYWNQEDDYQILKKLIKALTPDSEISYEECC